MKDKPHMNEQTGRDGSSTNGQINFALPKGFLNCEVSFPTLEGWLLPLMSYTWDMETIFIKNGRQFKNQSLLSDIT